MTDLAAVLLREYKLLFRNRINLILGIVPPALYLLLFATSMSNVTPQLRYRGEAIDYPDFIVPAIMVMAMAAGATATATSIFQEQLGGMLLELWSYPLRQINYVVGKLIATTSLVLAQGLVMFLVAALVFRQVWSPGNVVALLVGTICASLCLNGLYLYAATYFRDMQLFLIVINVVAPVLLFASPSFYPLEQMPKLLQVLSWADPLSYSIYALRDGLLYGFAISWSAALILLGGSIIVGILTARALLTRFKDL